MFKNHSWNKNIIFDLGGVILNIDFKATERIFRSLGFHNFDEFYTKASQIKLFDRLEEGKISPDEFRNKLRTLININFNDEVIDNAWNSMILDFPVERIKFLEQIKNKYRIFLLSNTNKYIIDFYSKNFRLLYKYEFSELFERMYLSYQVGMRKPDESIFKYVIEQSRIIPSQTLYIDDLQVHIDTAKKIGFKVYKLNEGEEINRIEY